MTIVPCNHCRLSADCEIRTQKLAAVRGAGLTKIQFKCQKRLDDLQRGMEVVARLKWVWDGESIDDNGYPVRKAGELFGVFMDWKQPKAQKAYIFFPDQAGGQLFSYRQKQRIHHLHISGKDLRPTGRTITLCDVCGLPEPKIEQKVGARLTGDTIPGRPWCEKCNPAQGDPECPF